MQMQHQNEIQALNVDSLWKLDREIGYVWSIESKTLICMKAKLGID